MINHLVFLFESRTRIFTFQSFLSGENLYRKESMLTPLKQTQNKRPRTDSSSVMSAYSFQNKRKSEDSDYPNVADSWIEQILTSLVKRDELDSYEFGQAWTKFNDEGKYKFYSL